MSGHLSQLESPLVFEQAGHSRNKDAPTESPEKLASKFDEIFVPTHSRPVEDVNFRPQPRRGLPEVRRLALDVDIPIMVERKESETEKEMNLWPDFDLADLQDSNNNAEDDIYYLLLAMIRQKASGPEIPYNEVYYSLALRQKEGKKTAFERIGLLRHIKRLDNGVSISKLTIAQSI